MTEFQEAFEAPKASANPTAKLATPSVPASQGQIEAHSQTEPAPINPLEKKKAPPAHFFTPEMLE